jgi:hypothetical protein
VPIQLDASYRFDKDWAAGLYFSYGFGQVGGQLRDNVCNLSGVSCSASDMRAGAQGFYTFNQVSGPFVPWAGLNLGWEQGKVDFSGNGQSASISLTGFELGLQVGGDYKFTEQLSVGPYLSYSFGQYNSASGTGGFPAPSISTTLHSWFGFGVIGRFNI